MVKHPVHPDGFIWYGLVSKLGAIQFTYLIDQLVSCSNKENNGRGNVCICNVVVERYDGDDDEPNDNSLG